jgi:hypothetical protein
MPRRAGTGYNGKLQATILKKCDRAKLIRTVIAEADLTDAEFMTTDVTGRTSTAQI